VTGLAQVTVVNNTHAEVVNKTSFPATYTFTSGDSLTFIAVPASGYSFSYWTVLAVQYSANPYTTTALTDAYAIEGTAVAVQPYSTVAQAKILASDYAKLGTDYATQIPYLISISDRAIDHELEVPEGYFVAGGKQFVEIHDGAELGCVPTYALLMLTHTPILTVDSVVADGTALTEDVDYVVDPLGISFLTNRVTYDYRNITVTYTAGYTATPSQISNVSTQLSASIIQRVIDTGKSRLQSVGVGSLSVSSIATFMGLANSCFTDSLKAEIRNYRNISPPKI
jgi:hypothetical protein